MESLQSTCVGVHAGCVVNPVRTPVEHLDGGYVIALTRGFPAYGLGFFDCDFPL